MTNPTPIVQPKPPERVRGVELVFPDSVADHARTRMMVYDETDVSEVEHKELRRRLDARQQAKLDGTHVSDATRPTPTADLLNNQL
jgi:hypothetical protein